MLGNTDYPPQDLKKQALRLFCTLSSQYGSREAGRDEISRPAFFAALFGE
jgi:hypothetical protein